VLALAPETFPYILSVKMYKVSNDGLVGSYNVQYIGFFGFILEEITASFVRVTFSSKIIL
jgi:hypothetical protein